MEIYATVFNRRGLAVDGLAQNQFEILDDGKPEKIQSFEPTDGSLSCALLLDATGSMGAVLPALKNAARGLIDSLRPVDSVSVYSFNEQLDELQGATHDKTVAERALGRLRATGRTALFDAIDQLAVQLEQRPGKKVILVVTDGGDNASVVNRQVAAERARKTGVPVFAIAEGEALHDKAAEATLRHLAEETGGHIYKAKQSKDFERIFQEIARNLRSGYLLTFQPAHDETTTWHRLRVVVQDAHQSMTIQARTGYSSE